MKKTKILEEFYYGNIHPFEQIPSECREFASDAMTARDLFFASLNKEQQERFIKYEAAMDIISMESTKNAFVYGFKMGAKFMKEIDEIDEEDESYE